MDCNLLWPSNRVNGRHDCYLCMKLEIIFSGLSCFPSRAAPYKIHVRIGQYSTQSWPRGELRQHHYLSLQEVSKDGNSASSTKPNRVDLLLDDIEVSSTDTEQTSATFEANHSTQSSDYALIKSWLETCQNRHTTTCGKRLEEPNLGLKLIDCQARQVIAASSQRYIALSYVWGTEEVDGFAMTGSLPVETPLVVKDAMAVATELGIPYLWVDRYCIDQSNELERVRTINQMNSIYSGAELTIIAAAGSTPDYGLPGVTERSRNSSPAISIRGLRYVTMINPKDLIGQSKWYTRGWTYQEMLLSRRRLVFTDDQIYFQCQDEAFMEKMGRTSLAAVYSYNHELIALSRSGIGTDKKDLYGRLQEYAPRTLSLASDSLNAFEGIFNAFRQPKYRMVHEGEEFSRSHFYGIPFWASKQRGSRFEHGSFTHELAWRVGYRSENSPPAREEDHRWPTWSWARLQGRNLDFNHGYTVDLIRDFEKIFVHFTHKSGERMAIGGYDIQREDYTHFQPWVDITSWTISGSIQGKDLAAGKTLAFGSEDHIMDFDYSLDDDVVGIHLGTSVATAVFLLVTKNGLGAYQRIGILRYDVERPQMFDHAYDNTATCPWSAGSSPRLESLRGTWKYQTLRIV